ncbi:MAG: hypothetical protein KatS3mg113_0994 [Planctomycetaceae bacterium]|nr:MAG: hypothetical protein KatS3mg113_0994 [Planctomycetaceae bacterium]
MLHNEIAPMGFEGPSGDMSRLVRRLGNLFQPLCISSREHERSLVKLTYR